MASGQPSPKGRAQARMPASQQEAWRKGGRSAGQSTNAEFFSKATPVVGSFNYRGTAAGLEGRPDRSGQPSAGHDLRPHPIVVYTSGTGKQELAHMCYCGFTEASMAICR